MDPRLVDMDTGYEYVDTGHVYMNAICVYMDTGRVYMDIFWSVTVWTLDRYI